MRTILTRLFSAVAAGIAKRRERAMSPELREHLRVHREFLEREKAQAEKRAREDAERDRKSAELFSFGDAKAVHVIRKPRQPLPFFGADKFDLGQERTDREIALYFAAREALNVGDAPLEQVVMDRAGLAGRVGMRTLVNQISAVLDKTHPLPDVVTDVADPNYRHYIADPNYRAAALRRAQAYREELQRRASSKPNTL